jgi:hypothetical protein
LELSDEVYEELTGSASIDEEGKLTPELAGVVSSYYIEQSAMKEKQIDDIVAAAELTDEEFAELHGKEELSLEDKSRCARYKLRKHYGYVHAMSRSFVKTYSNKKVKRNYKNLVRLRSGLTTIQQSEKERFINVHSYGADYQFMDLNTRYVGEQHRLALSMLIVGGWKSLDDTEYRHFNEFNLEFYFAIIHDACREFDMKQTSHRADPKSIVDMMSEVLNDMYGVKIDMNDSICKLKRNTKFTMDARCISKPLIP